MMPKKSQPPAFAHRASAGKSKKYHLRIFGCQMNKSDGERIDAVMQKVGYKPTDNEKSADVLIAVACSVRQSPMDRIYGLSGRWVRLRKQENTHSTSSGQAKTRKQTPILILTGCVLEFDKKRLAKNFDAIISITKIGELPKLINRKKKIEKRKEKQKNESPIINYQLLNKSKIPCNYLNIIPDHKSQFQAYVPIMTGCESFCTYCVVPYVRGKEVSRPVEEVVNEVRELIQRGYKEITLLGENVNNYSDIKTLKQKNIKTKTTDFSILLKALAEIPGKFWLRFVTSNPENFSDELIKVIADEDKICNYIHLPIQSGSDAILKKMNRKYTKSEYIEIIKEIKRQISNIAISTDIIVGFPGETKRQFEETAQIMRDLKFDMAYIAQYSPRPGTAATRFHDNVSREEKKRREKVLTEILKETALENNRRLVGKILEVLVEDEVNKMVNTIVNKWLISKTEGFKNVRFRGSKKLVGKFVKMKIVKANEWGVEGEIVDC